MPRRSRWLCAIPGSTTSKRPCGGSRVRQATHLDGAGGDALHRRRRGVSMGRPHGEHSAVFADRLVHPESGRGSRRRRRPRDAARCGRGRHRRARRVPDARPAHGPARRRQSQAGRAPAGLRQARAPGTRLSRARRHERGGSDRRRGHRAARELFRAVPPSAVLRGSGAAHAVRRPGAPVFAARSHVARPGAAHPAFDRGGDEDRQTRDAHVLGFLHRSRRLVPREHPGAHHAQDLPRRRGAPPPYERAGGGFPPRHHAPSADAAQLHHHHGPVRVRRRGGRNRHGPRRVRGGRRGVRDGVLHRVPVGGVLPAAAHVGLVFPHRDERNGGGRAHVRDTGRPRGAARHALDRRVAPRHRVPGRGLFLRRRAHGAGGCRFRGTGGQLRRHRGRERVGQVDFGRDPDRRERRLHGRGAHRRGRSARGVARIAARHDHGGVVLELSVQGDDPLEPADGPALGERRRIVGRAVALPSGRLRARGGRARRARVRRRCEPFGRAAPAARHGARPPARRPRLPARRGDVEHRRGQRERHHRAGGGSWRARAPSS